MRVTSWNCCSGTDAKFDAVVDAFAPDLFVMPESSRSPRCAAPSLLAPAVPHAWVGDIASKGLGVFAPTAETVDVVPAAGRDSDWSVAVRAEVTGMSVNLVGVWTVPRLGGPWRSKYLSALGGIFERHQALLDRGRTIVAGDFNCCGVRDDQELPQFMDWIRDRFGLRSACHAWSGETLGAETAMTHWWRRDPASGLHIDYVLVPECFDIRAVSVGAYDTWGATQSPARSDHAPLVVDLV